MSVNNNQPIALLTFRLADQFYALPIDNVIEVAAMMTVSTMPNSPASVVGLINRHGNAVPMLDLRLAFDLEATPPDELTLFIVAQHRSQPIGLIVDEILQVKYVAPSAFQKAHGVASHIAQIISTDQELYQEVRLQSLYDQFLTHIQS